MALPFTLQQLRIVKAIATEKKSMDRINKLISEIKQSTKTGDDKEAEKKLKEEALQQQQEYLSTLHAEQEQE